MKKILRALALALAMMLILSACGMAETLRFRDSGEEVGKLQAALKQLNLYEGDLDGKFGKGTLEAVKLFQARNGLAVDGKVGARTQLVLDSDSAVRAEIGTVVVPGVG